MIKITKIIALSLNLIIGLNLTAQNESKPNVIFFLVDDMGWTDAACLGSEIYQTPAIDKLASEGIKFTDAYAAHSMCIASRFSIMTGKYMSRNRKSKEFGTMHPNEITLADAMKEGGYATFFAGKWHLGKEGAYPQDQGFDLNIAGHDAGAPASYFYPYKRGEDHFQNVPNLENGHNGEYLTDRLTNETLQFIKQHKDEPFFVYLSHYAVHTPFEAKGSLEAKYEQIIKDSGVEIGASVKVKEADQKLYQDNATYAAMIESVDQSLQKVQATLKSLGLAENTIIIFTSDNGGDACKMGHRGKSTSNLPLKGGKCWFYEGGIRVPLIVKWPGHIKAGSSSDHVVSGVDYYPTIMDLVGLPQKRNQHLDGYSFEANLLDKSASQRAAAYWHFPLNEKLKKIIGMPKTSAIREGDYKLIEWYETGDFELYNLKEDIGEEHDLSNTDKDKAHRLLKQLRNWREEVKAPL
ncbi:MAG: sulfatase [Carboxylicivirga sp.]|jgi:arylsulfatase A-like enzyme|nr:sulfatase [Carboxylicivirga sp.]